MRKLLIALFVSLLTFNFFIVDAHAKRFGGGKSFGSYRQMNKPSSSYNPSSNYSRASSFQQTPKPAATASSGRKWLGPLAGLAVGGLLAALFMGHGIGSGLLLWLLIGLIAFFIINLIRSR